MSAERSLKNICMLLLFCLSAAGLNAQKTTFNGKRFSLALRADLYPLGYGKAPARNKLAFGAGLDYTLNAKWLIAYSATQLWYHKQYIAYRLEDNGRYSLPLGSSGPVFYHGVVDASMQSHALGFRKYSTLFGYMAPFGNYFSAGVSLNLVRYRFSRGTIEVAGTSSDGRYELTDSRENDRFLGIYSALGRRYYLGKSLFRFVDVSVGSEFPFIIQFKNSFYDTYPRRAQKDFARNTLNNSLFKIKLAYGFSF